MAYIPAVARSTTPTASDDSTKGFFRGAQWVDSVAGAYYTCVDATPGNAVWKRGGGQLLSSSPAPTVTTPSASSVTSTFSTYDAGTGWVT